MHFISPPLMSAHLHRIVSTVTSVRHSFELERQLLQQAALQLCRTITPPCGQLQFVLSDTVFTVRGPDSHHRPVLDFSLDVVFQYFTVNKLLQVSSSLKRHQLT